MPWGGEEVVTRVKPATGGSSTAGSTPNSNSRTVQSYSSTSAEFFGCQSSCHSSSLSRSVGGGLRKALSCSLLRAALYSSTLWFHTSVDV